CGAAAVAGMRDPDRAECGDGVNEAALMGGASALSNESTSLIIRDADPADAKVIARIHIDTWRSTYAGMIPDRVLVGMSASSQQAQWERQLRGRRGGEFALVAQDPVHGIIGFGSAGRTRGGAPYQGEVYTLYVHPDCQGQGIGRRLLAGLFDGLRERDLNSAVVWVLAMNPARFFYEAMGGARAAEREETIWGELLPEFAYGWATLDITAGAARA
ncbi:MAG: GNAT family N-acetyltransferase, partial [Alphaproteobacteria bacterium]